MNSHTSSEGRFAVSPLRISSGLAITVSILVWLAMLGPLAALLGHLSPSKIVSTLAPPGALNPLFISLEASALALFVLVATGTPLAWLLARQRLPAGRVWETGVLIPLLMPPLVIGLLLIYMVGPATPLGRLLADIHLTASNTFFALVLAEIYESAPYYILGAEAAFAKVDRRLEENAALLGDRWPRTVWRITLPLAAPGLATSLTTAWARAMGAFGAVIIIAYHPYGLPMKTWVNLEEIGLSGALPYALCLIVAALPLPILAYLWSSRTQQGRLVS